MKPVCFSKGCFSEGLGQVGLGGSPLKSHSSAHQSPMSLSDTSPVGLQSQTFWAFVSKVPVLKVGVPYWRMNPSLLKEKLQVLSSLLLVGRPTQCAA